MGQKMYTRRDLYYWRIKQDYVLEKMDSPLLIYTILFFRFGTERKATSSILHPWRWLYGWRFELAWPGITVR